MPPSLLPALALLLAFAATTGCGGDDDTGATADVGVDCSTAEGADTYAAGIAKTGAGGHSIAIMAASPAPPAKGDNDWDILVTRDDAPVTGLSIDVNTYMPLHRHGSSIEADDTETGEGGYSLTQVNMFMPGVWEVTVKLLKGEAELDRVVFVFCVAG